MPITFTPKTAAPWPATTAELDPSEIIVVRAFRRWVLGLQHNDGGHWTMVWNDFARQFGATDGKEALSGFAGLVKGLQCHARRTIRHHRPCCACLGTDEISLLCLVAACQNGRPGLARSLAEWLVRPEGAGELLQAGTRLAQVMRRHNLHLPARTTLDRGPEPAERPSITVH